MASVVKRPPPVPRWFWFASLLGCTPGFKRLRCKKLLKVTMSRIKLLRGRREVQVRQLRRDVAQLLQLGQTENAESRLDRLWKEQSLLSAYIQVGDYCQVVKANLSNIALPRECPVDLKEPIASLCFAASCCADLPELQEIREVMVLKYGKDFLRSSQEPFRGKHVNKTFLEAFSTKEQSEVSRKALLKGILKEYNVVQPKKPERQSKVANGPDADCNQHHSFVPLEKEENRQSARQTPSRPIHEVLNGEHTVNGETKNLGQHKHDPKNVQSHGFSEGLATETSYDTFLTKSSYDQRFRDRSRSRDHKRTTAVDQVGEEDRRLSSKQKPPNNKSLVPDCAVINMPQVYHEGPLPGEDKSKGHSKSKRNIIDKNFRSEKEVTDIARGQHKYGEAPPLRNDYEQIHGEKMPIYGKNVIQVFPEGPCNEALSQGCEGGYLQQDRNLYLEERNEVEREVYSRCNGYSRSKRVMHDFEKIQCKKGLPHSDCDYVKTNSERHSKSKRRFRPVDDDMQKVTSFHSHPKRNEESQTTAYEFESQQPSWRDNSSLPKHKDITVGQERKHSSKKSLHSELAEIDALSGAYPNAHVSQKVRKKLVNKHHHAYIQQEIGTDFSNLLPGQAAKVSSPLHNHYEDGKCQLKETPRQTSKNKHHHADIQQEIETSDFSKLLPDQAAKVSSPLPKYYEDGEYQLKETPRQTSKNSHKIQYHITDTGPKTKAETFTKYNETRPDEPAVEHCTDEGHVPENSTMRARHRHSRRTKKHNLDHVSSRRNRNSVNEEPLQKTFAEENVSGKASLPTQINGFSIVENESTWRERGQLLDSIAWRGSERTSAAEVMNGHCGYGGGSQKVENKRQNWEDHYEGPEVKERICELEKGSLLPSMFSKPPDRPPPPIPPNRVCSLPSKQPLSSPPVMPQRSATLETSILRGIQEPHVHPKLPNYEDLVASFAALRNKPHSSSSS